MSVREDIATNIVQTLEGITSPAVVIVSRNPINTTDLAITQYPAIMVRTSTEERVDMTQGGLRMGEIDYTIIGFVRASTSATTISNNIDTQRNQLIEAIEEALETDRQRNANSLNGYVTNVAVDDGTIYPLGRVDITFRVQYKYTRGTL
tara:strand:- start:95 stop:541 length:447 start_codon:yes stop_codon:yes gene_type:complete